MVEFKHVVESSAPAAAVLDAARDFSERRAEVWPNVSRRRFEVHASGDTFAEVTEAALQGLFWERSRYEWSEPGRVVQTVLESNALVPGSTWELTAVPSGEGSRVETTFRRGFKRTAKGGVAYVVNRFANPVYRSDLRRALKVIENQPG